MLIFICRRILKLIFFTSLLCDIFIFRIQLIVVINILSVLSLRVFLGFLLFKSFKWDLMAFFYLVKCQLGKFIMPTLHFFELGFLNLSIFLVFLKLFFDKCISLMNFTNFIYFFIFSKFWRPCLKQCSFLSGNKVKVHNESILNNYIIRFLMNSIKK
jgi:hypothetical protein